MTSQFDTSAFTGTTRVCFEQTLFEASVAHQAAALRAILEDYPPFEDPDRSRPKFRSPTLLREIRAWITRLETGAASIDLDLTTASEIVRAQPPGVDS